MLNKVILLGRLTRDPELRRTDSGVAVTTITLAVDRDYTPKDGSERETDFIDCVAWRQTGEFVGKYFRKGQLASVCGRLTVRGWTDKDGNRRRAVEVNVEDIYFAGAKKPEATLAAAAPAAPADTEFLPL